MGNVLGDENPSCDGPRMKDPKHYPAMSAESSDFEPSETSDFSRVSSRTGPRSVVVQQQDHKRRLSQGDYHPNAIVSGEAPPGAWDGPPLTELALAGVERNVVFVCCGADCRALMCAQLCENMWYDRGLRGLAAAVPMNVDQHVAEEEEAEDEDEDDNETTEDSVPNDSASLNVPSIVMDASSPLHAIAGAYNARLPNSVHNRVGSVVEPLDLTVQATVNVLQRRGVPVLKMLQTYGRNGRMQVPLFTEAMMLQADMVCTLCHRARQLVRRMLEQAKKAQRQSPSTGELPRTAHFGASSGVKARPPSFAARLFAGLPVLSPEDHKTLEVHLDAVLDDMQAHVRSSPAIGAVLVHLKRDAERADQWSRSSSDITLSSLPSSRKTSFEAGSLPTSRKASFESGRLRSDSMNSSPGLSPSPNAMGRPRGDSADAATLATLSAQIHVRNTPAVRSSEEANPAIGSILMQLTRRADAENE